MHVNVFWGAGGGRRQSKGGGGGGVTKSIKQQLFSLITKISLKRSTHMYKLIHFNTTLDFILIS